MNLETEEEMSSIDIDVEEFRKARALEIERMIANIREEISLSEQVSLREQVSREESAADRVESRVHD